MTSEKDLPEYLEDTYSMLSCAFPEGISDESYIPALSILHSEMSFRTIARVLSKLTTKTYIEILNDASGFGMDSMPDNGEIDRVKSVLLNCGFEEWLQHE